MYRGMCRSQKCTDKYSGLEAGDEFQDNGYVSTSMLERRAEMRSINVRITVPKGSPGAYIGRLSSHPAENEFLIPRGAKFRVTGKSRTPLGLQLDVILMSYGKEGPPIFGEVGSKGLEQPTAQKAAKKPNRDRYFTWEADDIVITKQGGKRTKAFEWKLELVPGSDVKGGPGSGHHGHAGRPGKRGGSLPGKGGADASTGGKSPRAVAKVIVAEAKRREPTITKTVSNVVQGAGGEMVGLESRLKKEGSLTRKIKDYARDHGVSPSEAREMVKDAVRYTAIFDANNYARGAQAVQRALEQRGWKRYDHQFKNYWRSGDDYDGYNCVFVNDEGFKFELQFHTPESIRVKAKSHVFYEEARTLPPGAKRDKLITEMTNLWGSVPRPMGWKDLPGVVK